MKTEESSTATPRQGIFFRKGRDGRKKKAEESTKSKKATTKPRDEPTEAPIEDGRDAVTEEPSAVGIKDQREADAGATTMTAPAATTPTADSAKKAPKKKGNIFQRVHSAAREVRRKKVEEYEKKKNEKKGKDKVEPSAVDSGSRQPETSMKKPDPSEVNDPMSGDDVLVAHDSAVQAKSTSKDGTDEPVVTDSNNNDNAEQDEDDDGNNDESVGKQNDTMEDEKKDDLDMRYGSGDNNNRDDDENTDSKENARDVADDKQTPPVEDASLENDEDDDTRGNTDDEEEQNYSKKTSSASRGGTDAEEPVYTNVAPKTGTEGESLVRIDVEEGGRRNSSNPALKVPADCSYFLCGWNA